MEPSDTSTAPTPVMGSAKTLPGVIDLMKQSKDIIMKRSPINCGRNNSRIS